MSLVSDTDSSPERQTFAAVERRFWDAYDLDVDEQYITLSDPDIRIRTLAAGEGDPLLFVHGGGSYASSFVPLIAELTDHQCLLFDRPACGLSDGFDYQGVDLWSHATRVLLGILDELGLDQVPLIGHSMGGLWSLWLAGSRPERVETVVLQGATRNLLDTKPPLSMRVGSLLKGAMSPLGLSPFQTLVTIEQKLLPSTLETAYGRIAYRGFGHETDVIDRLPDVLFELDRRHLEIPSVKRSMNTLLDAAGGSGGIHTTDRQLTASALADIEVPTCFVWGENDALYGPEYGQRAAEIMPAADIVVVPGGHLPWLDDPEQCAHLTREIVERQR